MSGAPKEEKKEETPEAGKASGGRKMGPMLVAVLVVLGLQAALAVGVVRFLGISDRAPKTNTHGSSHGEGQEGEGEEGAQGEGEGEGEDGESEHSKTPKKLECAEKVLSKTVTIAGTEAKRYLKASLCLEYDAEKYKDFSKKVEPQMIRVEATVNRILSGATFQVATNPKLQDSLTQDMTKEINKLLKHEKLKIHSVLVTEWLVQ